MIVYITVVNYKISQGQTNKNISNFCTTRCLSTKRKYLPCGSKVLSSPIIIQSLNCRTSSANVNFCWSPNTKLTCAIRCPPSTISAKKTLNLQIILLSRKLNHHYPSAPCPKFKVLCCCSLQNLKLLATQYLIIKEFSVCGIQKWILHIYIFCVITKNLKYSTKLLVPFQIPKISYPI